MFIYIFLRVTVETNVTQAHKHYLLLDEAQMAFTLTEIRDIISWKYITVWLNNPMAIHSTVLRIYFHIR